MMNYFLSILVGLTAHGVPERVDDAQPSSLCQQTFHFFALSSPGVFWIGEDVSGECHYSHILTISVKDSEPAITSSGIRQFEDWAWMSEATAHLATIEGTPLDSTREGWTMERGHRGALSVLPPVYDSTVADSLAQFIAQVGPGSRWHQIKGPESIALPSWRGMEGELLFAYRKGLYVNYEIDQALFFPLSKTHEAGFLLVFTHQPVRDVGLDSMHGFLIIRLSEHKR